MIECVCFGSFVHNKLDAFNIVTVLFRFKYVALIKTNSKHVKYEPYPAAQCQNECNCKT